MKYSAKAPAPEFVSEMLPFISNASVCWRSQFSFNEHPGIKPAELYAMVNICFGWNQISSVLSHI